MVIKLSISMSGFVIDDIDRLMILESKTNRSEFIEEMIRLGLIEYKKKKYKEDDYDE